MYVTNYWCSIKCNNKYCKWFWQQSFCENHSTGPTESVWLCINPDKSVNKLMAYNFDHLSVNLIGCLLENRRQFVQLNSVKSDIKINLFELLHGSTLGPTLFLIYINSIKIKDVNRGDLLLFTYDTACWDKHYSLILENAAADIQNWCFRNDKSDSVHLFAHSVVSLNLFMSKFTIE